MSIKSQIQEAETIYPNRLPPKKQQRHTHTKQRHMRTHYSQTTENQSQRGSLESSQRKNRHIIYRGRNNQPFLSENTQVRRQCIDIFKVL